MQVEIMTESLAVYTPETSLQEAAQMMAEHDSGAIPVVENTSTRKAVGIVTDRRAGADPRSDALPLVAGWGRSYHH